MTHFSKAEAKDWFRRLLTEKIPFQEAQTTLIHMRKRAETAQELLGLLEVVREQDERKNPSLKRLHEEKCPHSLDLCGTGGDQLGTFNVSTATAFVAAACGVRVAKHGNRSISSRSGSSDVLEALGVKIDLKPARMHNIFNRCGVAYLHAPLYHPCLTTIQPLRKKISGRTIFNLIGPLLNPYRVEYQMIGLIHSNLFSLYRKVVRSLTLKRCLLVSGEEGLDEVSLCGFTNMIDISRSGTKRLCFHPRTLGIDTVRLEDLKGGSPRQNAQMILSILTNEDLGPKRQMVLINTAFALKTARRVKSSREGYFLADHALQSGRAYQKFKLFRELTQR